MRAGPGFGEFVNDQETIFERIGRGQDPKTSAVVDHGAPGQWHGAKATTTVACKNDDEVRQGKWALSPRAKPSIDSLLAQREQILQGLLDSVESHDLTIGRFMELSHTLACRWRPVPS